MGLKNRISIIIPSYNRASLISETLDSVRSQQYDNWECLVVDDGSTDETTNIVRQYIAKDSRFSLFERNTNPKGAAKCRNIGLAESTGEYVIFLDSDDLLAPYCLSTRVSVIASKDLDFAIFPMLYFQNHILDSNRKVNYKSEEDNLTRFLSYDFPWAISSPIWRKIALSDLNGFQEDSYGGGQDFELHVRSILKFNNYKVYQDFIPDCFYRIHDNQRISNTKNISKIISKSKLILEICDKVNEHNQLTLLRKKRLAGVYLQQIILPLSSIDAHTTREILALAIKHFDLNRIEILAINLFIKIHSSTTIRFDTLYRILRRGIFSIVSPDFLPKIRKANYLKETELVLLKERLFGI